MVVLVVFGFGICIVSGCETTTKNYAPAASGAPAALPGQPKTLSQKVERIEIKEIEMEEPAAVVIASLPKSQPKSQPKAPAPRQTYHKVKKDQTLWSISRYYSVPMHDICRANKISDANRLKAGQTLKIPLSDRKTELGLGNFEWPLSGMIVNHYQQSIAGKLNNGIDIHPEDSYTVYAAKTGTVEFSQLLKGYGYTIILRHPEGLNTIYSNLCTSFVSERDSVEAKQAIGEVGTDARSQETFLHFEIRKEDQPLNPLRHLP
ncbi:peptidoglycan DD-metalloendopeptidase family protein [Candidatus Omnitrophota bacterium]